MPPLRFHWSSCPDGDTIDTEFVGLCRGAEAAGIESVHIPIGASLPDALALATVAGADTTLLRFRVGWDFGDLLASLRGSQLLEAWDSLGGRLIVHLRVTEDEFRSAGEFLPNCRALFGQAKAPSFDVEGETAEAAFLAIQQGDCLWRLPHRPNQIHADALPILHFGKEVGLVSSVIARETRQLALDAAASLLPDDAIARLDEQTIWTTRYLWRGANAAALVGSFEEIAGVIHGFRQGGISQFLLREWPGQQELNCFAARILPLIRGLEG